jgi:acyl-CoA thioester hydrolase
MNPAEEPTAGVIDGRVHILPVRVYYEDTDFTGVVYHGAYVRFLERGRSDFLRLAGVHHAQLLDQADPLAFTVVRIEVRFKRAARIDDALQVRTTYDRVRGPRLYIGQTITRGKEIIAEAEVEAACIDLSGRPRRPPLSMKARLFQYFLPEVDDAP